jgi:GxxExxY protein
MTQMNADERDPRTYAIIGAAMEVHRELGSGFFEPVYREALAIELTHREVPHTRETPLPIFYRGTPLTTHYKADFICFGAIIVELKALTRLSSLEHAQTLNILKASHLTLAPLINFGGASLEYKRIIRST